MRQKLTIVIIMLGLAGWAWGQNTGAAAATGGTSGTSGAAAAPTMASPTAAPVNTTPGAQPTATGAPTTTTPGAQATAPSAPVPANSDTGNGALLPNNNGMVINGGYATSAAPSAPLVVTPTVSLGLVSANPVGATSGTANNQVGATSSAMNNVSAPVPSVIQQPILINPNYDAINGTNPVNRTNAANSAIPAGINAWAGMSSGYGAVGSTEPAESLGDVARYYKTHAPHANRTFTNDDIARLNQQGANISSVPNNPGTLNQNIGTTATNTGGVTGAATSAAPSQPNFTVTPGTVASPQTQQQSAPKSKQSPYVPPMRPPQ